MKKVIRADKAPKPIAPYSQAVRSGDFLFLSGMTGVNPKSGKVVEGGVRAETRKTLENIKMVLEESGLTLEDVAKVTVFLKNIADFKEFNEAYSEFFESDYPARTTVQATPPGTGVVEIEVVASASR